MEAQIKPSTNRQAKPYSVVAESDECEYATVFMYDMPPPKPHPIAPSAAKYAIRGRQSGRPASSATTIPPSAPASAAPYSCPNCPRTPQPIDTERPASKRNCQVIVNNEAAVSKIGRAHV